MKKAALGIVFPILILCSSYAHAWDKKDKVAEIRVIHGNKTVISFQGIPYQGCVGSQQNPNPYFVINEGDSVSEERKQMLAIALTALTSGKDVWVVTGTSGGDSPQCDANGYEWLYQLSIYP